MPPMRPGASRRGAAALGIALLLLGSSLPAATPSPPRIRHILFPGARELSARELRGGMRLKAKSWWQPLRKNYYYGSDHLERDLDRVLLTYREAGFPFARFAEARVRYVSRDWVDLEIPVEEGPRVFVSRVRVFGATGDLATRLTRAIRTQPGSPLRALTLDTEEETLRQVCGDTGYLLAEVTRESVIQGDSAEVRYWVTHGPLVRLRKVRVTGLERTRERVVLRESRLRTGETLRRSRLLAYQERLFELDLFRTVRITPAYCDTCPRTGEELAVDLVASLAEKKPGWYGGGFGFSSADQVRLVGEWGYRNLLGRARALQANALLAYPVGAARASLGSDVRERQFDLTYSEPWVFNSPIRGQVHGYYRFNREVALRENIFGLALRARRDIGRSSGLTASLENKWVATTDSTVARSHYQTRFVSLAVSQDRRDFALDPHLGQLNQFLIEYAGGPLGGSASFARGTASHAAYLPLSRLATVAYRVRAGYIHPIGRGVAGSTSGPALLRVPFDERFRTGGGTSVRGHTEKSLGPYNADGQPLGGLALLLANAELRFPIFWQFAGAVFVDAGNVWADYHDIKAARWTHGLRSRVYSQLDMNYSVGGGLRLRTPVGPLRVDYGVSLNRALRPGTSRGEWHVSLGQAF
jgi:outer membrane protein insertion porin family